MEWVPHVYMPSVIEHTFFMQGVSGDLKTQEIIVERVKTSSAKIELWLLPDNLLPAEVTFPLNPNVDKARDGFTQDLANSRPDKNRLYQRLRTCPINQDRGVVQGQSLYDCWLRVVFVFAERPAPLEEIDFC